MPYTNCCGSFTYDPDRFPYSSCCHAYDVPDHPCPTCGQKCEWIIDADIEEQHIDNEWMPIFTE